MINTTNVQSTAVTKRYSTTAPFSDWKVACFRKCEGHFLMVFSSCLHLKQQILGCYYGYIFQSVSVSRVVKVWVGKERERENENTPRERSVIFSISTWAERRPSTCTSHQTHIPPLMNLWLTPSPTLLSRSVISVFEPPHSHKRSHVAWYKSPAAERTRKNKKKKKTNVKHKTHTLYIHSGHAWPSTASPEAKHVKGYLCSSLTAFCTCFQATANKNCFSLPFLSRFWYW